LEEFLGRQSPFLSRSGRGAYKELIKSSSKGSTHRGSEPVDPV
jgi:hypothetical protein